MTSRNHQLYHNLFVVLLALAPACADVEGEHDELERAWAPATPSAEQAQLNALTTQEDAAAATEVTPSPVPTTAEADAGSSCEADWECGATDYCSRLSQRCTPRCQGDGCVGPSFARDNDRLISDGRRVCFADDSDVPGEYALRLWDGSDAQASTLTRAMGARALFLDDGYCYFHAADALRRAALNGGCVELVQAMAAPPTRIWRDGEHVFWIAGEGAEQQTLRIAGAQNAKPETATSADSAPASFNAAASVHLQGRVLVRNPLEGRLVALPEQGAQ